MFSIIGNNISSGFRSNICKSMPNEKDDIDKLVKELEELKDEILQSVPSKKEKNSLKDKVDSVIKNTKKLKRGITIKNNNFASGGIAGNNLKFSVSTVSNDTTDISQILNKIPQMKCEGTL